MVKKLYKIGDYVVYKRDVCKIIAIKEKQFMNMDYYVLVPISDETLKIDVDTTAMSIDDYRKCLLYTTDSADD